MAETLILYSSRTSISLIDENRSGRSVYGWLYISLIDENRSGRSVYGWLYIDQLDR